MTSCNISISTLSETRCNSRCWTLFCTSRSTRSLPWMQGTNFLCMSSTEHQKLKQHIQSLDSQPTDSPHVISTIKVRQYERFAHLFTIKDGLLMRGQTKVVQPWMTPRIWHIYHESVACCGNIKTTRILWERF